MFVNLLLSGIILSGIILAKTITHAYTDRYAMIAVIGLTGLLVWSLSRITSNGTIPALLVTVLGIALFGVQSVRSYKNLVGSARYYEQTLPR